MKKIKFGRYIYIIVALFLVVAKAFALSPDDVEYKDASGRVLTVIDPDGLMSPEVRAQVNDRLEKLRLASSTEVEVVIPPDLDGLEPQEWCERLFTRMKIGKEKEDNGLLVMISPGARQAFIMPGYGMEGVFTDIACKKISEKTIKPAMQNGDLDAAVINSTDMIISAINDPAVADELRSGQKEKLRGEPDAIDAKVIWTFIRYVAAAFFFISLILFVIRIGKVRKEPTDFRRALSWRASLKPLLFTGIMSLGSGLLFYVLAYALYRYWRTKRVKCSTCGAKMRRLPEDKDNELLSQSQDLEERLNTIDYDVWECPQCGTVERFPYRVDQKKYTECPRCHTVAMSLDCDTTIRPATTRTPGEGVRIYGCKYCHNQLRKPYRIPRKEDPSAAIAAAAVLGAASGHRGGGGGGGGFGGFGGFGGGATGGGGAGSSW